MFLLSKCSSILEIKHLEIYPQRKSLQLFRAKKIMLVRFRSGASRPLQQNKSEISAFTISRCFVKQDLGSEWKKISIRGNTGNVGTIFPHSKYPLQEEWPLRRSTLLRAISLVWKKRHKWETYWKLAVLLVAQSGSSKKNRCGQSLSSLAVLKWDLFL